MTCLDISVSALHRVHAGVVEMSVTNRGPDTHEVIVVRAEDDQLPLRSDGITVDEDALKQATVGSVDDLRPGDVGHLSLHLAPGHYVLFCNMSGHYLSGMDADLVVRP